MQPSTHNAAPRSRTQNLAVAFTVALVTLLCGFPAQSSRAAIRNAEDLLIVDCLLPGQVRKLGKMSNFLTARRPVRTTQSDCEIRGGEYVAFDRANYQTALNVWLQSAEAGDAAAQNYLGEIYQKGLGIDPDYVKAVAWFTKAANQGNKRAKVNLGYLYEQGMGVQADLAKALNLYREGSGLSGEDLVFASTVTVTAEAQAEIVSLRASVEAERAESKKLREQLSTMKSELNQRKGDLQKSNQDLSQARTQLEQKQKQLLGTEQDQSVNLARAQLQQQEQIILQDRQKLNQEKAAFENTVATDKKKLQALRSQEAQLNATIEAGTSNNNAEITNAKQQLTEVRRAAGELVLALDEAVNKVAQLETKTKDSEKVLAEQRAKYALVWKKMSEAVSASQQDRELLLLLEQQLTEKQRQVGRQQDQIAALETRVMQSQVAASSSSVNFNLAGPMVEIMEPALTVTRGRPAALVRSVTGRAVVRGKVISNTAVQQVQINGQNVAVNSAGLFAADLPLAAEGSTVTVVATDSRGANAKMEFLLLPSAASAAPVSSGSRTVKAGDVPRNVKLGKYYALVIGNDNYSSYSKLSNAVNDANSIAKVLKINYGFSTTLLTNATRLGMLSALNDMREKLKPEDNLLVYFAGHGEIDAATKEGYWIASDSQKSVPASWISNRAISDILNTMDAAHVMVVADSCYSGAMTRSSVPTFSTAMSDEQWPKWMAAMNESRSRTALTSGGLAPVPDSGGGANSAFAKALLTALSDNSKVLEGQRLYRELTAMMALSADASAFPQEPQYAPIQFAGHEAGEFFFIPKG